MDWTPGGMSGDVEDRRGSSGGGGFNFGGGGLGIVGVLVLLVISVLTGRNFLGSFFSSGTSVRTSQGPQQPVSPEEDRSAHLVSFVLDDAQQTWTQIFAASGKQYRHAKLVLYRGVTDSGCGTAQSSSGPFYCPEDEKVYMDLNFWDDLRRFGASGEFAQSYVLAHEIGHHIQKITGIEREVRRLQDQNPSEQSHLSVDTELQADCFAGVWAHSTAQRKIINDADMESGLKAAAAVGDDNIRKMEGRSVSPESFTHGSSAQRMEWFRRGLQDGTMGACNTFAAQN